LSARPGCGTSNAMAWGRRLSGVGFSNLGTRLLGLGQAQLMPTPRFTVFGSLCWRELRRVAFSFRSSARLVHAFQLQNATPMRSANPMNIRMTMNMANHLPGNHHFSDTSAAHTRGLPRAQSITRSAGQLSSRRVRRAERAAIRQGLRSSADWQDRWNSGQRADLPPIW
jgi:hypothetical protein